MRMASGRIRNIDDFDMYNMSYVVPGAVARELERLAANPVKGHEAQKALALTGTMRHIIEEGDYADQVILDYVKECGGIVATIDGELKREIKAAGGGIVSLHNDNMVLEAPSGSHNQKNRRRLRRGSQD